MLRLGGDRCCRREKRRDPAEPIRRVSPYSGPEGQGPVFTSINNLIKPALARGSRRSTANAAMLTCGNFRNGAVRALAPHECTASFARVGEIYEHGGLPILDVAKQPSETLSQLDSRRREIAVGPWKCLVWRKLPRRASPPLI